MVKQYPLLSEYERYEGKSCINFHDFAFEGEDRFFVLKAGSHVSDCAVS